MAEAQARFLTYRNVEGVSHKEAVQVLHCFCGPLLPIAFHAPPN
jgi:hypothetical protein